MKYQLIILGIVIAVLTNSSFACEAIAGNRRSSPDIIPRTWKSAELTRFEHLTETGMVPLFISLVKEERSGVFRSCTISLQFKENVGFTDIGVRTSSGDLSFDARARTAVETYFKPSRQSQLVGVLAPGELLSITVNFTKRPRGRA